MKVAKKKMVSSSDESSSEEESSEEEAKTTKKPAAKATKGKGKGKGGKKATDLDDILGEFDDMAIEKKVPCACLCSPHLPPRIHVVFSAGPDAFQGAAEALEKERSGRGCEGVCCWRLVGPGGGGSN